MRLRILFILTITVALLAILLMGQATAATGPVISGLTSPTHPDATLWYPDNHPLFTWSAPSIVTAAGVYDSPGEARSTVVSGNTAFLADGGSGLQLVDVSNPVSPSLIGSIDTAGTARDVAVTGQYAYVADQSDFRVIDISDPVLPVLRNSVSQGSFYEVAVQNQYAYVAAGPGFGIDARIKIFNIDDPVHPVKMAGYLDDYSATGGQAIAVVGQYAFLADGSDGVKIVDISVPERVPLPVVGTCETPGSAQGIAVDGHYAYVADGLAGMQIIDFSNYANPVLVGPGFKNATKTRSITEADGFAYVVDDFTGLNVVDVTNPENPMLVATFDTPGTPYGVTVSGDHAYVSDLGSGLRLFNMSGNDYSFMLDQTALSVPDEVVEGAARSVYMDAPDGVSYFHVKARDSLGNWGAVAHKKVEIGDHSAPQVSNIQPAGSINTDSAVVSAYYSDPAPASGIDLASVNLTVSGANLSGCNVTPEKVVCTASGLGVGDHTIDVSLQDKRGNSASGSGGFSVIDTTPPVIAGITPTGTVYTESASVSAYFTDPAPSSGIDTSSASMVVYGSTVSDCVTTDAGVTCQASGLGAGIHGIEASITDNAGNTGHVSSNFRRMDGRRYMWTWYDDRYMHSWILMANPAGATENLEFDLNIGGKTMTLGKNGSNGSGVVGPGQTLTPTYQGVMDGPVTALSMNKGGKAIMSQRSLMGDSLEEVLGTEEERMSDHFYWTWYDMLSPGFQNWVLVSNPGTDTVRAEITIAGERMTNSASGDQYFDIAPGENVTPTFPGKQGGPVEVKSYRSGGSWDTPADHRAVIASQRVLTGNGAAFNEVPGIPATDLTNNYTWTWYDMQSPGFRNWILLANPGTETVRAEIRIAGELMTDSASGGQYGAAAGEYGTAGNQYFDIGPGEIVTPTFPGKMDGPVEVSANGNLIASQRVIAGPSFEEVPGYPVSALSNDYHWTWYDMSSAGVSDWILIANPNDVDVGYEIRVGGVALPCGSCTIPAHQRVMPTFPGLMGGPVEVKSTNGDVMVSQRVMWKGHFNEVLGTNLE